MRLRNLRQTLPGNALGAYSLRERPGRAARFFERFSCWRLPVIRLCTRTPLVPIPPSDLVWRTFAVNRPGCQRQETYAPCPPGFGQEFPAAFRAPRFALCAMINRVGQDRPAGCRVRLASKCSQRVRPRRDFCRSLKDLNRLNASTRSGHRSESGRNAGASVLPWGATDKNGLLITGPTGTPMACYRPLPTDLFRAVGPRPLGPTDFPSGLSHAPAPPLGVRCAPGVGRWRRGGK